MTVYLVNIALIFIWSIVLLHIKPNQKKKKWYCTIVAVQWILISGLRDFSVGRDTEAYYSWFENVKYLSFENIFNTCWNYVFNGLDVKDPGYNLLQKIFQLFSDDYRMWLFFIAILFTGLMARWIYKYSAMPEISFLLYSVLFFSFFAITGHRQTIATALIVFLGYEYAKKRQFLRFVIISFIAFLLHKSSIVFILFYVVANIKISLTYTVVVTIATMLLGIFGQQLYVPVAGAMGFTDDLIFYDGVPATTYATVLLLLCIVVLCLYPWISKRRTDAENLYNMLFLTVGSTVLLYHNQSFMRIQQYFSLIIMVMVPEVILTVEKKYRAWPYMAVVIVLVVYFLRLNVKYKFFFMP